VILYETVVLGVVGDFLFWITVVGYFVTKYFTQTVTVPPLPSSLPAACCNLIAFLLVFYLTACYTRYTAQHDAVMNSGGFMSNICLFAHNWFSFAGKRRIFRYLNAAHILSFVGLEGVYDETNLFAPLNTAHRLLSETEIQKMKLYAFKGSTPYRVLLSWVMESIREEFIQGGISNAEMLKCLKLVFQLRGSLTRVYHFKQQPIPFTYIALVEVIVDWFLPFYAVSIGYTSAGNLHEGFFSFFLEFLYVVAYSLITTGLRRLGKRLQDPLGMDLEDFDVLDILSSAIDQTNKILRAPRLNLISEVEELDLYETVWDKIQPQTSQDGINLKGHLVT